MNLWTFPTRRFGKEGEHDPGHGSPKQVSHLTRLQAAGGPGTRATAARKTKTRGPAMALKAY